MMWKPMSRAALLGAALSVSLAHAAAAYPPPLQALIRQGVQVVKPFAAPEGMTGYVVRAGGQFHVVYVTADKKYAFVGAMLDAQGNNLTDQHLDEHAPRPDYSKAWKELQRSRWVAEGAAQPKRVVYVMADPYCPYCHLFWKASQPYEQAGLQVRWVWVSYLRPDGAAKVAAILEAKDPAAAIRRHESRFAQGGIEPLKSPQPKTLRAIDGNTTLMHRLGIQGTPAIFYKDEQGKVHLLQGLPKLSLLPRVFRLPKQAHDDPDLQRFQ
jgi:thiol:disulfide interchange protein DsbG